MAQDIRIGVALELGTQHIAACEEPLDFLEYGYHAARGIPQWLTTMAGEKRSDIVLHPLDVNVGSAESLDADWLDRLARDSARLGARACVTDAFYWYHGSRVATWPRPVDFALSDKAAGQVALAVQDATSIPFRVENPPVEWMPGHPDIWRFFDALLAQGPLGLCLDLSHLLQFEWNLHRRAPVLPRSFAWEAVQEIHMSGLLAIEIAGQRLLIDQHDTMPGAEQFALLGEVLDLLPAGAALDICLEMEPHMPAAIDGNVRALRRFVEDARHGA